MPGACRVLPAQHHSTSEEQTSTLEATGPTGQHPLPGDPRRYWHPLGAGGRCRPHGSHQLHPCGNVTCPKQECWRVLPARLQPVLAEMSPWRSSGGFSQREAIAMTRHASHRRSGRRALPGALRHTAMGRFWCHSLAELPRHRIHAMDLTLSTDLVSPEVLRPTTQRHPLLQRCPAPNSSPAPALPTASGPARAQRSQPWLLAPLLQCQPPPVPRSCPHTGGICTGAAGSTPALQCPAPAVLMPGTLRQHEAPHVTCLCRSHGNCLRSY